MPTSASVTRSRNELRFIMVITTQVIINGILFGTMYGTAAIGLSLIFGTMRIVFIAQGSVIVFFGYLCYWAFTLLGIDPYLSLIIVLPLSVAAGALFYYVLFKEAAALQDRIGSLLIAVGLMFFLENFMEVVWTPDPRAVVTSYGFFALNFLDISVTFTRLVGLLLAILATFGVFLFLRKTLIGTAVRAASEDIEATALMGINPNWVNAAAFAIGIGLAGLAGVNLATTYSFDPVYGFDVALKALFALTLGGIGNVVGALLGGIILGLIQSLGAYFIGAEWAQALIFGVFLVSLIVRPYGLFGGAGKKL
jgi:branched-chain amino acid transport system permease protein